MYRSAYYFASLALLASVCMNGCGPDGSVDSDGIDGEPKGGAANNGSGGTNSSSGGTTSARGGSSNTSGGTSGTVAGAGNGSTSGGSSATGGSSANTGGGGSAAGRGGSGAKDGSGGGGATGGATGVAGSGSTNTGFSEVLSEAQFNSLFPKRKAFYTYAGLLEATKAYPAFASTGSLEIRKREVAAFLANVARETGQLIYIEQIAKDVYCAPKNGCACEPGKQYYGRGPIQISWNYNYCSAGKALGVDLRANPEIVAERADIAWATGLWFWMTQSGAGNYTPHEAIIEQRGFGETIRSINGSVECNGGYPEAVEQRASFFANYCSKLGTTQGENLRC